MQEQCCFGHLNEKRNVDVNKYVPSSCHEQMHYVVHVNDIAFHNSLFENDVF